MQRELTKRRLAQALGTSGERTAEQYLRSLGARVLARNFRCAMGELDLVVEHEGDLVAVEVKTRTQGGLQGPEDALQPWKVRRVARALAAFALLRNVPECGWRIDAVVIDVSVDGRVGRIEHFKSIYEQS